MDPHWHQPQAARSVELREQSARKWSMIRNPARWLEKGRETNE
jgi:hypothetical protein